jgi:hypothetical protein
VGTATLGTAGNVLETVGTATVDTAGTVLATVGKEVGETLGAVRTGVVDLGQDALKIITKPGETLKSGLNTVGGLGDTLIGALTDDGKTAVNIVQNPLQAAKKAASTVANVSKKVGTAVAKGATALVNNPVTAVTNTAKATGKIVHDLKTNLVDNSLKDVDKAVLGMAEGAAANPLTTAALVAGGALVGKALAGESTMVEGITAEEFALINDALAEEGLSGQTLSFRSQQIQKQLKELPRSTRTKARIQKEVANSIKKEVKIFAKKQWYTKNEMRTQKLLKDGGAAKLKQITGTLNTTTTAAESLETLELEALERQLKTLGTMSDDLSIIKRTPANINNSEIQSLQQKISNQKKMVNNAIKKKQLSNTPLATETTPVGTTLIEERPVGTTPQTGNDWIAPTNPSSSEALVSTSTEVVDTTTKATQVAEAELQNQIVKENWMEMRTQFKGKTLTKAEKLQLQNTEQAFIDAKNNLASAKNIKQSTFGGPEFEGLNVTTNESTKAIVSGETGAATTATDSLASTNPTTIIEENLGTGAKKLSIADDIVPQTENNWVMQTKPSSSEALVRTSTEVVDTTTKATQVAEAELQKQIAKEKLLKMRAQFTGKKLTEVEKLQLQNTEQAFIDARNNLTSANNIKQSTFSGPEFEGLNDGLENVVQIESTNILTNTGPTKAIVSRETGSATTNSLASNAPSSATIIEENVGADAAETVFTADGIVPQTENALDSSLTVLNTVETKVANPTTTVAPKKTKVQEKPGNGSPQNLFND